MSQSRVDASIIILCYNAEPFISEVLSHIYSQNTSFKYEVIAIDSGSSDDTLKILKKYSVRIHEIQNEEFGHGKTRNLGARLASGEYLVFLTQDATPAHDNWMENLVRPLKEDHRIAGAYSRQFPRPDCNPIERRDIEGGAGPISRIKKVNFQDSLESESYQKNFREMMLFSNVSSCIRKDAWERIPFNEDLVMMEDQAWCKEAIESNFTVLYEASSVVYHSHNHSLKMTFKRHYDYGLSYRKCADLMLSFKNVVLYTFYESFCDMLFILLQKQSLFWKSKWFFKALLIRFAMRYGLYRGVKS